MRGAAPASWPIEAAATVKRGVWAILLLPTRDMTFRVVDLRLLVSIASAVLVSA